MGTDSERIGSEVRHTLADSDSDLDFWEKPKTDPIRIQYVWYDVVCISMADWTQCRMRIGVKNLEANRFRTGSHS